MKSPWTTRPSLWQSRVKVQRALDGGALLDVLEDLRVARLVADDQQAAAGLLHRLQRLVVGRHARGAGPGEAQRLQLLAQLDGARLLDVEGVVVEEELLDMREELLGVGHLGRHIVGRPLAPCVPAERLRPQAEGALRRAAARASRARRTDAAGRARCTW